MASLTPADAPASEEIQQPLPELPVVVGDIAFSEAAFSGPPSTMMQEAYEHAASWGAYADPNWELARQLWSSNLTRPTPKARMESGARMGSEDSSRSLHPEAPCLTQGASPRTAST